MVHLPELGDPRAYGFFFDFDGTLTELADTPGAVIVEDRVRLALDSLFRLSAGALAIVTGREIDTIDEFLAPLKLPVAGVHGFERRNGAAKIATSSVIEVEGRSVEKILSAFVSHNPGLLLERKRGGLALHYRLRPELELLCTSLVEDIMNRISGAVITRGKMVIEARFHKANKGTAINDFLQEHPFRGRVPFFAGDDVTDEDAFKIVNALGGISVKVGPGSTAAKMRVSTVNEFVDWLQNTAEALSGTVDHG